MIPRAKNFHDTTRESFFILSTGRTATTFLAELFDSQPEIQGLHEPKPSRILRMWGMANLEGKVSKRYMHAALFQKRRKLFSPRDSRTYIESNPFLIGFTDVIDSVFKDPFVIHVVRDPRDFVKSSMNHGNDRGIKLFLNNHLPYWYPRVEQLLGRNDTLPMRFKAAAYWTIANKALLDYGKAHPERYLLVRYEDVFHGTQVGMEQLIGAVGINVKELTKKAIGKSGVNASRYSSVQSWDTWSNEDCKLLDELCGPLMRHFGYGAEQEWQKRIT